MIPRRLLLIGGVVAALLLIIGIAVGVSSAGGGGGEAPGTPDGSGDATSSPADPGNNDNGDGSITIIVQNMEKKAGLAGRVAAQFTPDVMLVQEIDMSTEDEEQFVHYTSTLGYGTAIRCGKPLNVRRVKSPKAEAGGFIKKKSTVAECAGVQFVSFHGYNGTPSRDVGGLVEHVKAVLEVMGPDDGPAVFAGDFNTWSQEHLDAVASELGAAGLSLAASWEYPGSSRPVDLDHAFMRGLKLLRSSTFQNEADHLGARLVVVAQGE